MTLVSLNRMELEGAHLLRRPWTVGQLYTASELTEQSSSEHILFMKSSLPCPDILIRMVVSFFTPLTYFSLLKRAWMA